MKKQLLLILLGGLALPAFAQQSSRKVVDDSKLAPNYFDNSEVSKSKPLSSYSFSNLAKTTAVPFVSEDFGSGTPTSLPTGWSASGSGSVTATWKWATAATTGAFSIGAINSPTATNGWMVYDSDSIGKLTPTVQISGYLQSPSYNCFGHPTVELSFQEYYRKFADSCFIDVSNDGGLNFTTFPIQDNNALSNTAYVPSNPYLIRIDISSVAANEASVILRFRYKTTYLTGTYNWLVDDIALSELELIDLKLNNPAVVMYDGTGGFTSFGNIPKQFIDTLVPVVSLSNLGSSDPGNVAVHADITLNGATVYQDSSTFTTFPYAIQDSILDFPPYYTTATGAYRAVYSVNQMGDAVSENDQDTSFFNVNDTLYHRNSGALRSSYVIHRSTLSSTGAASFNIGMFYSIPTGKFDTLSGILAGFQRTTTQGSSVIAHVFKFVTAGTTGTWTLQASSSAKTLAAADISVLDTVRYTRFDINPVFGQLIFDEGDYAVVIQGINVPDTNTVLLLSSDETTPPSLNYLHGIGDTSQNDGITGFGGPNNLPFRVSSAPLVRLIFGKQPPVGINEISNDVFVGSLYPNPANNEVKLDFTALKNTVLDITITNAIGQVITQRSVGRLNAQSKHQETFNTANLSNGVYYCTMNADGVRVTQKFVVAH